MYVSSQFSYASWQCMYVLPQINTTSGLDKKVLGDFNVVTAGREPWLDSATKYAP
jgi:hypothetical protein